MPVRVAVSERVQPSSFSSSSSSSTYSHICEPIRMESTHSVCVCIDWLFSIDSFIFGFAF
jgi:hypothetical protein